MFWWCEIQEAAGGRRGSLGPTAVVGTVWPRWWVRQHCQARQLATQPWIVMPPAPAITSQLECVTWIEGSEWGCADKWRVLTLITRVMIRMQREQRWNGWQCVLCYDKGVTEWLIGEMNEEMWTDKGMVGSLWSWNRLTKTGKEGDTGVWDSQP